jgi:hypothetical protein
MNDKLNADNYHYRVNLLHRDDVMRTAENQRLAQLAAGEPKPRSHLMSKLIRCMYQLFTRHHLRTGDHKTRKLLRHAPK